MKASRIGKWIVTAALVLSLAFPSLLVPVQAQQSTATIAFEDPGYYQVAFVYNWPGGGGSVHISPYRIPRGESFASIGASMYSPMAPPGGNLILGGWNTQPDGDGSPLTADTPIYNHMVVYAQWEEPQPPGPDPGPGPGPDPGPGPGPGPDPGPGPGPDPGPGPGPGGGGGLEPEWTIPPWLLPWPTTPTPPAPPAGEYVDLEDLDVPLAEFPDEDDEDEDDDDDEDEDDDDDRDDDGEDAGYIGLEDPDVPLGGFQDGDGDGLPGDEDDGLYLQLGDPSVPLGDMPQTGVNGDNNGNETLAFALAEDSGLGNAPFLYIANVPVTRSFIPAGNQWAVANLILAALGALAYIIALLTVKQKDRQITNGKQKSTLMIVGCITALAGITAFALTQNMSGSAVAADDWTILHAILAAGQCAITFVLMKSGTAAQAKAAPRNGNE